MPTNKTIIEDTKTLAGKILIVETYSNKSLYLYEVRLCPLYEQEIKLNAGRFENYVEDNQEYFVHLRRTNNVEEWFSRIIYWIAETITCPWCFDPSKSSTMDFRTDFSFADEEQATLFALMWDD